MFWSSDADAECSSLLLNNRHISHAQTRLGYDFLCGECLSGKNISENI